MNKIGVITYNAPHRKTQDLLLRLLGVEKMNPEDIIVYIFPYGRHISEILNPLYPHRPKTAHVNTEDLCSFLGLQYIHTTDYKKMQENACQCLVSRFLIAGAGIIPKEAIGSVPIINAHPGYLPNVRGLDALKWAIYQGHPIGVTTHTISSFIDCGGYEIEKEIIDVRYHDTFYHVAERVYDTEIKLLARAAKMPINYKLKLKGTYPLNSRMPWLKEVIMYERFEKLRKSRPI